MHIEFDIEPHGAYLCVTVTGEYQAEDARQALTRVLDACVTSGLSSVLIDIRQMDNQKPLSTLALFEYGVAAAENAARYQDVSATRYRMVYLGLENQLDPERFGETVIHNRGIKTRVTTDLAEALAWLGDAQVM